MGRTTTNPKTGESTKILPVERILPARPFLHGMATAFDIYGAYGVEALAQIKREWDIANAEPLPSTEESINDCIATINREYRKLLSEQAK